MRSLPTKALSVRAPWWWFILHGGKDIENRDWPTTYRGTVLLHASKWWQRDEGLDAMDEAVTIMRAARHRPPDSLFPTDASGAPIRMITSQMMRKPRGCIVGMVDIVGCVERSDSPWFFGRFGFQLVNPVAFATPIPCKGMLGFFSVSDDVLDQVRVQIGEVRP